MWSKSNSEDCKIYLEAGKSLLKGTELNLRDSIEFNKQFTKDKNYRKNICQLPYVVFWWMFNSTTAKHLQKWIILTEGVFV